MKFEWSKMNGIDLFTMEWFVILTLIMVTGLILIFTLL